MGVLVQGSHPGRSLPPGTPADVSECHGLQGLLQGLLRGSGLQACSTSYVPGQPCNKEPSRPQGTSAQAGKPWSSVPWPRTGHEAVELQVWQGSAQFCLRIVYLDGRGEGSSPGLLGKVLESRCQRAPRNRGFRVPGLPLSGGRLRPGVAPGAQAEPALHSLRLSELALRATAALLSLPGTLHAGSELLVLSGVPATRGQPAAQGSGRRLSWLPAGGQPLWGPPQAGGLRPPVQSEGRALHLASRWATAAKSVPGMEPFQLVWQTRTCPA